jgi:hypothetical protein
MESYPDSIGSSEDEVCHGSSSFRLQPDSSQSPRMDPATENIRKIHSQVQACIDSTSMQLKNDYQHRAALYQAWCPPTRGSARANTSPIIQPRRPGSIGNSPRGNVGGMWGLGQHPTYMQQQQQPPEGSQGSLNASSFADFFRSRRSGSASNLDALRPSPMPFIQALVQDVRASREAANGRCGVVARVLLGFGWHWGCQRPSCTFCKSVTMVHRNICSTTALVALNLYLSASCIVSAAVTGLCPHCS